MLIAAMVTSRQRFSAVHATTPIFHGGGLARLGTAGSGPASGGGVGLIQGGLPIGDFVWVHGVSDFFEGNAHPVMIKQCYSFQSHLDIRLALFIVRKINIAAQTQYRFSAASSLRLSSPIPRIIPKTAES